MKKRPARKKALGVEAPLHQLKITLRWSKPPIWRRILVRGDTTLDRFHMVVQRAMGWMNCHLHQFMTRSASGTVCYGISDPEFDTGTETLDERLYTVAHLAPVEGAKFIYEYDFGDGWLHDGVVENIIPPVPVCLGGAGACPPEDCGGVPGYEQFLAVLANPKHPEHESMKTWIGGKWDAASFPLQTINADLQRL